MNSSALRPLLWSRTRWLTAFLLVMAAQTVVVFLLSDRAPMVSRQPGPSTTFRLVADAPPGSAAAELLSLEDPTLFALPDFRGFSGPAWMDARPLRHSSRDWNEPQRWLALPLADLGATFAEFVRTNVVGPLRLADRPAPRLSDVAVSPVPLPVKSTFRIEGDLTKRELLSRVEVPSMSHSDVLTNTVVQVAVNRPGFVFFPPIVLGSSGSKAADERALDLAAAIRFKPVAPADPVSSRNPSALTWGTIVFQWHTVEMSNNPAAGSVP